MTTLCICDIAGLLGEKLPEWAVSVPARPESPARSAIEAERDRPRNTAVTARRETECEPVPI